MKRVTLAAILVGALAVTAKAQDAGDAPDRGVARLSLVSGEITVQRGDSGEMIAGERNAPLVARDHVFTGQGSRAEIQFDWANMIRLTSDSEVRLAELEDSNYRIELAAGTATFRVLRESSATVEISTPAVSVRPLDKGTYRMTVRDDGTTEVTVRSGRVEIFTTRGSETVSSGRTIEVRGDTSDPEYMISDAIPRDEWDRWNDLRDRDLDRTDSYQHVSRHIYGADDLNGYGRWIYDPTYGWVWAPDVPSGWAPYRVGRWAWVDFYGWTWVSDEPWGWAPYHYGRWYYRAQFGWVWYPGIIGPRYYWRPALVGFFGWGSGRVNIGVSFGFGNVGWVPLAPYEVYRPWYGRGRNNVTVNNVTVVNNINIVNTYRNARFVDGRNGVTSVTVQNFGHNHVTINNHVHVTEHDLYRAGDVRGRMPFEPSRESRRFSDRTVTVHNIPAARAERTFVTRPRQDVRNTPAQIRKAESSEHRSFAPGRQDAQPDRGSVTRRGGPAEKREPVLERNGTGWRKFDPSRRNDTPGVGSPRNEPRTRESGEVARGSNGDQSRRPGSGGPTSGQDGSFNNRGQNGSINGNGRRSEGDASNRASGGFGAERRGEQRTQIDSNSTRNRESSPEARRMPEARPAPQSTPRESNSSDRGVGRSPVRESGGDRGGQVSRGAPSGGGSNHSGNHGGNGGTSHRSSSSRGNSEGDDRGGGRR